MCGKVQAEDLKDFTIWLFVPKYGHCESAENENFLYRWHRAHLAENWPLHGPISTRHYWFLNYKWSMPGWNGLRSVSVFSEMLSRCFVMEELSGSFLVEAAHSRIGNVGSGKKNSGNDLPLTHWVLTAHKIWSTPLISYNMFSKRVSVSSLLFHSSVMNRLDPVADRIIGVFGKNNKTVFCSLAPFRCLRRPMMCSSVLLAARGLLRQSSLVATASSHCPLPSRTQVLKWSPVVLLPMMLWPLLLSSLVLASLMKIFVEHTLQGSSHRPLACEGRFILSLLWQQSVWPTETVSRT